MLVWKYFLYMYIKFFFQRPLSKSFRIFISWPFKPISQKIGRSYKRRSYRQQNIYSILIVMPTYNCYTFLNVLYAKYISNKISFIKKLNRMREVCGMWSVKRLAHSERYSKYIKFLLRTFFYLSSSCKTPTFSTFLWLVTGEEKVNHNVRILVLRKYVK